MKRGYVIIVIMVMLVIGCSKEELIPPEVKKNDVRLYKDTLNISNHTGTLEDPVKWGEVLLVWGELFLNKKETFEGEFGVEIDKFYRGDAAKYRLPKVFMEKELKEGREWAIVQLNVYNFGEMYDELTFNKGDIAIYTLEGKMIKTQDVEREEIQEKVMLYGGEMKKIILPVIIKEEISQEDLYVGVNKLKEDYYMEEGIFNTEEEGNTEEIGLIRYISLAGGDVIDNFYEEEDEEDVKIEIEIEDNGLRDNKK